MKKLMLTIVMAVLMVSPGFAEWQTVSYQYSTDLYSIAVTSDNTVHIVGANGAYSIGGLGGFDPQRHPANYVDDLKKIIATEDGSLYICSGAILKSTDNGTSWTILYAGSVYLNDITFVDENNGIAVGNEGLILKTTDAGENWSQVSSPITTALRGVSVGNNSIAIAVGFSGTIIRSIDNGQTWEQIASPVSINLYGVDFTSGGEIVVVGGSSIILRSADNGQTWEQGTLPTTTGFASIDMVSDGSGIAVGGEIINTTNNGHNWSLMIDPTVSIWDICVLPDNSAWAVGNDGTILYNPAVPLSIELINEQVPDKFQLAQNYPNPFNPTTVITYSVPINSVVNLVIYNALGQVIDQVVSEFQSAGTYQASWDGSIRSSGIYFYQLQAGEFIQTRKMLLVK